MRPDRWDRGRSHARELPAGISVHIGRLVVDSELVGSGGAEHLESALSRELTRLLRSEGVTAALHGSTVRSIEAPPITQAASHDRTVFGQQLAGALHASLSSPPPR